MLSVVNENFAGTVVLHCSGRIVAGEEAWTLYNAVISLHNKRRVVLDLTGVTGTDARGLGVLVFLQQWALDSRVQLQLVVSRPVQEMLELTGLQFRFDVRSSDVLSADDRSSDDLAPAADFPIGCRPNADAA